MNTRRLLITGGHGFLGRWVRRRFELGEFNPYDNYVDYSRIFTPKHSDYDLTNIKDINDMLYDVRPHVIIHLAAHVGGIGLNMERPGELFYDNLMMGVQLMEGARKAGVSKLVNIGTVCAYPKHPLVPFLERNLWNGYPEETNAPYGLAKKMLLVQGNAYRQQYGFRSIFLLPTNLYGPGDNFCPDSSHVIPALITKIQDAIDNGEQEVSVWGSGRATRDFLYVEDCAEAIYRATLNYDEPGPMNIGSGREISIRDLAFTLKHVMGYTGRLVFDETRPDGQPRRVLAISRMKNFLKFTPTTSFEDGLRNTVEWWRTQKHES